MTRTLMHPMAADTARNNRHFQLIVDVHLLLLSDGDLLLGRRANTGYGDGAYEPPSDRLAERETLVEAAVRVAGTQVGIELDAGRVSLAHVMHDVSGHGRMAFFLTADGWERPSDIDAAARLAGTGSYSDFGWYPLTELPANMIDRARVAVRNVRRDGNDLLKKLEKDHKIGQDEHHKFAEDMQKLTDTHIKDIDQLLHAKEQEIMQV